MYPSVDLRIYQEHITRGEAQVSQANATGRRNSNAFAPPRASIIAGKMPQMEDDEDDDADDADDDDDDDEDDHNKGIKQVNRARVLTKK